jgi:hypothetical protein
VSVSITIEGLDKFLTVLDPARAVRELDKAVNRAAEVLRDDTKKMPPVSKDRTGFDAKGIPVAPVSGGTLRQSIQKRRVALMAAEVYVGVGYGENVHQGTSRMPARPFFTWQLEDFHGKEKIEIILHAALERIASP